MFKPTQAHSNADGLSRLPLPVKEPTSSEPEDVSSMWLKFKLFRLHFSKYRQATRRDPLLSNVKSGWPGQVADVLKPYKSKQRESSIESGCIMWRIGVNIPKSLQSKVQESLHENHPRVTRMKAVARSYVWWSGLDKEIEDQAKSRLQCQETKSTSPVKRDGLVLTDCACAAVSTIFLQNCNVYVYCHVQYTDKILK